jgi:hypothetical protein
LASPNRKQRLDKLAHERLGRPYNVVADGLAIARFMSEEDNPLEIREVLVGILQDRLPGDWQSIESQ